MASETAAFVHSTDDWIHYELYETPEPLRSASVQSLCKLEPEDQRKVLQWLGCSEDNFEGYQQALSEIKEQHEQQCAERDKQELTGSAGASNNGGDTGISGMPHERRHDREGSADADAQEIPSPTESPLPSVPLRGVYYYIDSCEQQQEPPFQLYPSNAVLTMDMQLPRPVVRLETWDSLSSVHGWLQLHHCDSFEADCDSAGVVPLCTLRQNCFLAIAAMTPTGTLPPSVRDLVLAGKMRLGRYVDLDTCFLCTCSQAGNKALTLRGTALKGEMPPTFSGKSAFCPFGVQLQDDEYGFRRCDVLMPATTGYDGLLHPIPRVKLSLLSIYQDMDNRLYLGWPRRGIDAVAEHCWQQEPCFWPQWEACEGAQEPHSDETTLQQIQKRLSAPDMKRKYPDGRGMPLQDALLADRFLLKQFSTNAPKGKAWLPCGYSQCILPFGTALPNALYARTAVDWSCETTNSLVWEAMADRQFVIPHILSKGFPEHGSKRTMGSINVSRFWMAQKLMEQFCLWDRHDIVKLGRRQGMRIDTSGSKRAKGGNETSADEPARHETSDADADVIHVGLENHSFSAIRWDNSIVHTLPYNLERNKERATKHTMDGEGVAKASTVARHKSSGTKASKAGRMTAALDQWVNMVKPTTSPLVDAPLNAGPHRLDKACPLIGWNWVSPEFRVAYREWALLSLLGNYDHCSTRLTWERRAQLWKAQTEDPDTVVRLSMVHENIAVFIVREQVIHQINDEPAVAEILTQKMPWISYSNEIAKCMDGLREAINQLGWGILAADCAAVNHCTFSKLFDVSTRNFFFHRKTLPFMRRLLKYSNKRYDVDMRQLNLQKAAVEANDPELQPLQMTVPFGRVRIVQQPDNRFGVSVDTAEAMRRWVLGLLSMSSTGTDREKIQLTREVAKQVVRAMGADDENDFAIGSVLNTMMEHRYNDNFFETHKFQDYAYLIYNNTPPPPELHEFVRSDACDRDWDWIRVAMWSLVYFRAEPAAIEKLLLLRIYHQWPLYDRSEFDDDIRHFAEIHPLEHSLLLTLNELWMRYCTVSLIPLDSYNTTRCAKAIQQRLYLSASTDKGAPMPDAKDMDMYMDTEKVQLIRELGVYWFCTKCHYFHSPTNNPIAKHASAAAAAHAGATDQLRYVQVWGLRKAIFDLENGGVYCRRSDVREHVDQDFQMLVAAPCVGYRLQIDQSAYVCCSQPGCGAPFQLDHKYQWLLPDGTYECPLCTYRKLRLLTGQADTKLAETGVRGGEEAVQAMALAGSKKTERKIRTAVEKQASKKYKKFAADGNNNIQIITPADLDKELP